MKPNAVSITTREGYDAAKSRLNEVIKEATKKGMLESDMDNEYTQEISVLAKSMAVYEDEYLNISFARKESIQ